MAEPDQVTLTLGQALLDLLQILDGNNHGMLRGTCEATLAEAQGAQIGPDGFNHIQSLRNALAALTAREDALDNAINQVGSIDASLAQRIRQILSPLLNQSSAVRATLEETEEMALELERTNADRLEGVAFGQGGLGTEIARDSRSLVSTQIMQMAAQLRARGIEPNLIPSIQSGATQLMDKVRQLPITVADATQKLAVTAAAMRAGARAAITNAGQRGIAVLSEALEAVGAALAALGDILISVPIFIDPELIKRSMNPSPTEA